MTSQILGDYYEVQQQLAKKAGRRTLLARNLVKLPMTFPREKQTYFGALDYRTKEFLVQAYPAGNSENTIKFLHYLQVSRPGQKILVIWDGASYHKSAEIKDYLQLVNQELSEQQ